MDVYTHGHHGSVVSAHATRTIANSAAYLEPFLVRGKSLLDVGCGPGSITVEFADRLGTGAVAGVDLSALVIDAARAAYPAVSFETMDLYALDIADDSYDIVHAHQVLQHVSDPVAALAEMHRVAKPGGIVAVRDADYAAMHWAPANPALDRWLSTYRAVAQANRAEPDAGRRLIEWARRAGLGDVTPSVSTWLFADPTGRAWWARTWAERIEKSALAEQAVAGGFASAADLAEMATGWHRWAAEPDAWFVVVHGELICRT